MSVRLHGHVVVITGAARGLGAAYARECARRGAALLLTDVDEEPLTEVVRSIGAAGGIARALPGDITAPGFGDELTAECLRRWGSVDGWVNNAGIERMQGIESSETAGLELMLRVNVLGTLLGTAAAARAMIPAGAGSIVNITSGAQHGMPQLSGYGATKGAVASLTYAAALELAGHGIRVNALSPLADTRMTDDLNDHVEQLTGSRLHAPGVLATPERIAPAVAFLLADDSRALTGQVVRFDGTSLTIVRHPEVDVAHAVTAHAWDAEAVAAAFDGPLREALVRPGFSTAAASEPEEGK